ncbi:acyl-CoA dehydrogenase family protein [Streptomyces sp. NPDC051985]|uniref:acyl-CoA dehydrogenase family protein n=1 Tax=Streptomyces sp. NPDC051985 TaxID=3155807 RepID=UPI003447B819
MADEPREFVPAPETTVLREVVRDHCRRVWDEAAVRAVAEKGEPVSEAWRALGTRLGVLGLTVPERWGGAGAGLVEAAVVGEELGAVLAPLPYTSALLAARMLTDCGDNDSGGEAACGDLLPGLCDGSRTFAVVATDADGRWAAPAVSARPDQGGWQLSGAAGGVVDADLATDLLVVSRDGALFHVGADATGVTRTPVATLDLTRTQADVSFVDTPGRRIGRADLTRAGVTAAVLLSAELVGVARAMLETAVSHARERKQFGRPIGSFQAVQQRCADMLVEVELATSAAAHAAWTHDHGGDDPVLAASLAHVVGSDAARAVVKSAMQVLGGVSITWEHTAHLYLKRAIAGAAQWGGRAHRSSLAALVVDAQAPPQGKE